MSLICRSHMFLTFRTQQKPELDLISITLKHKNRVEWDLEWN